MIEYQEYYELPQNQKRIQDNNIDQQQEQNNQPNKNQSQKLNIEKYLRQYNEDGATKIRKIKEGLTELEQKVQEITQNQRLSNQFNEVLLEIKQQFKEIESLEKLPSQKNILTIDQKIQRVQKDNVQKQLTNLNQYFINQNQINKYQTLQPVKINISISEDVQNFSYINYQQLETKVIQIENLLGINEKTNSELSNLDISKVLQGNIDEIEMIEQQNDEEIENKKKKIQHILQDFDKCEKNTQYQVKDMQMVQQFWEEFENYQKTSNLIIPCKNRLQMIKTIHEESDQLSKASQSLEKMNTELKETLQKTEQQIVEKRDRYQLELKKIMCQINELEKKIGL